MHQIVHTKVRRRNLLRPIMPYAIREKPSVLTNLYPCWDAANNVYPDQTPQLATSNRGLQPSRETYNSQQNSYLFFSSCWDAANNVYPDQTPQIVAPNRGLHHPQGNQQFSENYHIYLHVGTQQMVYTHYSPHGKPTILSKTAIHFSLHAGTQRIMSTHIRHRNLLRLIGVYNPRGKPTMLSKTAI